jgi:hypothetical protein
LGGWLKSARIVRRVDSGIVGFSAMSDDQKKVGDAAFALIGEFLFHWSYLESTITEGIQSLLSLETPQGEIILANVTFRDKTSMASTLSHLILTESSRKEEAIEASKLFNAIVEFNGSYRNVLVHNPFDPREGGGIEIFRIRAKGKYEVPETIWDSSFFEARFTDIDHFIARLDELFKRLKGISNTRSLAKAIMAHHSPVVFPLPIENFSWPGAESPPQRPPQADKGSPPRSTTQQEDRGTIENPPPKDSER